MSKKKIRKHPFLFDAHVFRRSFLLHQIIPTAACRRIFVQEVAKLPGRRVGKLGPYKPMTPNVITHVINDIYIYINDIYTIQETNITYPTLGKGKSSSNMPYQGNMLVSWSVYKNIWQELVKFKHIFRENIRSQKIDSIMLRSRPIPLNSALEHK